MQVIVIALLYNFQPQGGKTIYTLIAKLPTNFWDQNSDDKS